MKDGRGLPALFAALVLTLWLSGCDRPAGTGLPRPLGWLWSGPPEVATRVWFVTADEREPTSLGRWFSGSPATFRYRLHGFDPAVPSAMTTVLIGEYERERRVHLLGHAQRLLWLWNEGLEAREPGSLEPVLDAAGLRAADGTTLPADPRFYGVSETLDGVVFRGPDARLRRVDANGQVRLLDAAAAAAVETERRRMQRPGVLINLAARQAQSPAVVSMTADQVGLGPRTYVLLTPHEADEVARFGQLPRWRNSRATRTLWSAESAEGPRVDPETLAAVGDASVQAGGLLLDTRGYVERDVGGLRLRIRRVWQPVSPPSLVFAGRAGLDDDAPWRLSRVGLDGDVLWSADSNLVEVEQYLATATHVVLAGYRDHSAPLDLRAFVIVTVSLADGAVGSVELEPF